MWRAPVHLFVYGTLRSGYDNRWARLLRMNAVLWGPARVQGTLKPLGPHMALRLSPRGDWVAGEVYRVRDASVFRALDAYEGPGYRRVACLVRWRRGIVRGQVYVATANYTSPRSD